MGDERDAARGEGRKVALGEASEGKRGGEKRGVGEGEAEGREKERGTREGERERGGREGE